MGTTSVFIGVRRGKSTTCFASWTRDYVEDAPHILAWRVIPRVAAIGLGKAARALESVRRGDETRGLLESAVEHFLDALARGEPLSSVAGPADLKMGHHAAGVVLDPEARVVDVYRKEGNGRSTTPRASDLGPYKCVLRCPEDALKGMGDVMASLEEGWHEGVVSPPRSGEWEEAFFYDGQAEWLSATPGEDEDDALDQDPPDVWTTTRLYPCAFMVSKASVGGVLLRVVGRRERGSFRPVWAGVSVDGEPMTIYAEKGPYEVWEQVLEPEALDALLLDMDMLEPSDLIPLFSEKDATLVLESSLDEVVDGGDMDATVMSPSRV